MKNIPARKTVYGRLPKWVCIALMGVIAVLVILPALPHKPLYIPGERYWGQAYKEPDVTDTKLYKAIVADLESGASYYSAAATEHRARHYPTFPPQVFREPTLAWFLAVLRFPSIQVTVLFGLYWLLVISFYRELSAAGKPLWTRLFALAVAVTGTSVIGVPNGIYWHEIWAALLIALSLLSYRKVPLGLTILAGLAACLIREIAVPYLLVMVSFALWQHRWKEAAAWLGALALFFAVFAVHLLYAGDLHRPGDLVSQGWLGLYGWDFSIATARWNVFLHLLPAPGVALAMCLGILGLAGVEDERAHRAALTVFGYVFAFLVVGRPDNFYWGILYAPLLSAGFLFVPAAVSDLLGRGFASVPVLRDSVEEAI